MTTDVIEEIISRLDPADVPVQYIVMAKIVDFKGEEKILRGEELKDMMENPDLHNIAEARVILNVKKMRKTVISEIDHIYDEVNRMFNMRP
ncbi:MAG: hypothetical protein EOP83_05950 [Verrucomicrobiaceae bacterium]|nr:MAG: hypothetical protein EOP83_05950 [Verrucomicrobiaceae bacterium]